MPVLVTGVAGFIGAHVAGALLRRGDAVIGIDDFNVYYAPALKRDRLAAMTGSHQAFRLIEGDFAEPGLVGAAIAAAGVDRIVHLGAQAGVRHSIDAPRDYLRSNLAGQLELLEVARALKVRHVVYASSSSVYGEATVLPLSADARTDAPVSFYAATKKAGEAMAESYAHLYAIPMTGLRFFTVYGPWGRPDMAPWKFTDAVLRGQRLPLYNQGRMRRDFTYIDDIVAGVLAALDRPPVGDGKVQPGGSRSPHAVYNLGNDQPVELQHFVDVIAAACGREALIDLMPMQPGDVTATWADIGPARRDLGFAPATPLEAGMPQFVDWFRRYAGL